MGYSVGYTRVVSYTSAALILEAVNCVSFFFPRAEAGRLVWLYLEFKHSNREYYRTRLVFEACLGRTEMIL